MRDCGRGGEGDAPEVIFAGFGFGDSGRGYGGGVVGEGEEGARTGDGAEVGQG